MNRENFYEKLSNELLGCFYCYILEKINKDELLTILYKEKNLIEKVAKKRGLSLMELRIIGYWVIQKEKNLSKDEH